ncbi:putative tricarboxylate carrier [Neospora caninum Liverpool]|uniref:Putative tricarboxylate carrier n=1 Tax=Neospora caninum (strain Liverpool) TaxID=572307 RepID=F0VDC9_NEOCL|nr:putative tricarboxylate carrier [Neospora caninum Liverpool]CBZ51644.1 putative tricarboxylate carrier [Neospora caninum Liverpool]CEL65598.1 TPA: tricarboxylate carrier, putative [Neospora caninum Liverpool]|eukprot:XP_003881677.1 putative tricarboxylate carrier [Neospora caninum Liverpool]
MARAGSFPAEAPGRDMNAPMRLAKHDTSTYWGRVFDFQQRINPRFMFVRETEARESAKIVNLAQHGKWKELRERGIDEKKLQEVYLVAQSTINASDGSVIHPLFRLAAFCPVNIPIGGGMLLGRPTFANSVFWQWVNQTYNACFNWANGNRSSSADAAQDRKDIIKGYIAAVCLSVGLAVSMNGMLARSKSQGVARKLLQAVVPYTAVAAANFGNTALVRGQEIQKGIPVYDADKTQVGISKKAATQAVVQTGVSRVVLPVPALLLPYPVMSVFNALLPITRTNAFVRVGMELSVIFGCLFVGLPLAVGMFPEYSEMDVKDLELELQQDLKKRSGGTVQKVYFHRGV